MNVWQGRKYTSATLPFFNKQSVYKQLALEWQTAKQL